MKKILILSSFPAPYRIDVFKGIAESYEVDLIFGTDKDQNRSKDFFVGKEKMRYLVSSHPEDKAAISECVKNLSRYSFVLAYDWYLPYALKIIEKCIHKGIPYLINCDGAFLPTNQGWKNKLKNAIKRRYVRHANKCLASGKQAAAYFRFYGAAQENIVIHPFTSLHTWHITEAQNPGITKETMKAQLGLADKKMVLTVGQFIPRKGFDVLLNAWGDLDNENQLVIIGGGDLEVEYLRIIEAKHYKNVRLINFMSFDDIVKYYQAADVFTLPTREDIWGLVINEAMAYGLPVVSSDRCVAALELIEDGCNGYIVETENVDALHEKIGILLNMDCNRIAKANQKKIEPYTIENIVNSHVETFKNMQR